ncbi:MAG: Fic family protein [Clostridia bacterium]|nr:Fic family protein [Clostridia bacterium]
MRAFNYSKYREQKWDSEVLGLVAAIYKEAGKQEMYLKQRPEELEKLVEIAKIQSTESSNAIEGIVTTDTRIRQLVAEKTTPRNRSEQEIAGYRDVLSVIHESFDAIPITRNYILQLHKILYSHTNNPMAGQTKNVQNYISATWPDGHTEILFTPLSPFETPPALDQICVEYDRVIGNLELEPLIAIPVFIHDFLCIHPFNDGNGRMSRLLTTLLLYRSGFYVGRYISLEAKIAKNKDLYYEALGASQHGWHEGCDDPVPFIKYLLGMILAAYRDFADRFALVEQKLPALETVRLAVQQKIGRFTKQDIRELCPALSLSSVEGALRKMVADGEIKREGAGKNTQYIRV